MSLKENIAYVWDEIEKSAAVFGRKKEEIALVAVSKTVPVAKIEEAMQYGMDTFGENRIQEFRDKYEMLHGKGSWHIIGRLQKNKLKYIIGKTALVHSVSSISTLEEIHRLSEKQEVLTDCLIQINIGNEETKSGILPEELSSFLEAVEQYDAVRIQGLMAIAPFMEDEQAVRPYFAEMRTLFEALPETKTITKKRLSMGMSHDFRIAIEEGANMVRVGSLIFGERI